MNKNTMYKIILRKNVVKFLNRNKGQAIYSRFNQARLMIASNPTSKRLDITSLAWQQDLYRLRIWKYRFIFKVIDQKVIIEFIDADSRGWIYK